VLDTVLVNPVAERVLAHADLADNIGDRTRRVDHKPNSFRLELRGEFPALLSRIDDPPFRPDLIGSAIRNVGGTPPCTDDLWKDHLLHLGFRALPGNQGIGKVAVSRR